MVPMDVDKLQQALINIVERPGVHRRHGPIDIVLEKQPGERAVVRISDTGRAWRRGDREDLRPGLHHQVKKGRAWASPIATRSFAATA
ncbi:MAG: HAMP domain-containing histidine kinase [Syntrophaceae bacterium]|nr:HAMP domain-containing histidine kinase [Syntrophaceae bacterium]